MSILTLILLVPLVTALVLAAVPRSFRFGIRVLALASSALTLLLGLVLAWKFNRHVTGYQLEEVMAWLPSAGIQLHLGVDGVSIGLVLMGILVAFAATCASWEIRERVKEYYILLMLMIGGVLGAFMSVDLFFFYFFHELALVPTFIMIAVWGTGERRSDTAFKISIYLSLGALLALVGLIALYVGSGLHTFDLVQLTRGLKEHPLPAATQRLVFPLLLFGFGILVSLWPFHTWAPRGYGSAPTATAMLHAGVLKKFGLFGLIKVALPLCPDAAVPWMRVLAVLCLGNIVYCGLVAVRQRELGLLLGNSSVAHMGFAFLGLASLTVLGVTGTVVVMVAHGLLAALSFALLGQLRQVAGTSEIARLGGLLQRMPFIGAVMVMAMMAGCGVPGFANFPGEAMVLFGAWKGVRHLWVVLAVWGGLVIGAVYMLRAVRNILHGPLPEDLRTVSDAGPWRRVPFVLLTAALIVLGCCPSLLVEPVERELRSIGILAPGQTTARVGDSVQKSEDPNVSRKAADWGHPGVDARDVKVATAH